MRILTNDTGTMLRDDCRGRLRLHVYRPSPRGRPRQWTVHCGSLRVDRRPWRTELRAITPGERSPLSIRSPGNDLLQNTALG